MEFKYFSRNGVVLPAAEAVVPLASIEYAYGFGVYESIRVANGVSYFLNDHVERLKGSARTIGLEHTFTQEEISENIAALLEKNKVQTCNIKILLVGGKTDADATLNILCLNPLFPDKKIYRDGVKTVTYAFERPFPHAKTLNMLQSYIAYRKAKEAGGYDALLINRDGYITEGTRTNFFCVKGKMLYSPREEEILLGVTRRIVLKVAADNGYVIVQKDIRPENLAEYEGAFLTSTSSKILPISYVDKHHFSIPETLKELMKTFDGFLETSRGVL